MLLARFGSLVEGSNQVNRDYQITLGLLRSCRISSLQCLNVFSAFGQIINASAYLVEVSEVLSSRDHQILHGILMLASDLLEKSEEHNINQAVEYQSILPVNLHAAVLRRKGELVFADGILLYQGLEARTENIDMKLMSIHKFGTHLTSSMTASLSLHPA